MGAHMSPWSRRACIGSPSGTCWKTSLSSSWRTALQIRSVPGRKSDVNDAMWIADLLAHGLIRGSFVPPAPIHELRDLTRTRKQLVREVAQHTLRIQKVLEDANLKLTSVLSDVLGMSGRAMIEAIIRGETDPERLADLSQGRLKASRAAVVAALQGRVTPHHRFLLRLHLTHIDTLERAVRDVEARLGDALVPFQAAVDRLMTIPAVRQTVARVIVAEIGLDMSRFPTAGHLVSWAGLCPRLDESAGKRRSTRTRPGAPWLKTAWSKPRGSRHAPGTRTCVLNSFVSRVGVARRRRSWRSPPPCSPPRTTS